MKKPFTLTLPLLLSLALSATNVTYTVDNSSIFANPERGFYLHMEKHVSKSSPNGIKGSESQLTSHKSSDKGSLILIVYYLDNFKTTATIPDKVLTGFDEDMQALRSNGMKCILRFAYSQYTTGSGSAETGEDATLEIALQHMAQYKSHIQANADVIYVVQAGIVGTWGEWYYSSNFGNQTSHMNAKRRTLVDSLLTIIPTDRYIQLRTPLFKTEYIGNTTPLTSSEAYQNTPKARLGHHNDAFLYGPDNMGTYQDTATQKPYLAQETLYVPIGGECDVYKEDLAAVYCTRDKTVADMSRLHWTYINKGYAEATTSMWRNNGTFDELNRDMGYRFQLISGTYAEQAKAGEKASVSIQLKNVGYAPLYNERPAYIVLKNSSHTYKVRLASDPRTWLPNGAVTTINEQVKVPSTVATGTYQLYLYLPDAYSSLASNPAYSVRFANSGSLWDSSTGMNKLNAQIQVTNDGTAPVDPSGAITLPATLSKANVDSYSEDMTWYNTDYFNFGEGDGENTSRWADWNVYLKYPGEYIISEVMATANGTGHSWGLQLLDATDNVVSEYTTKGTWSEGTIAYDDHWDLSSVAQGTYTLRVKNVMEWGQPKLQSLTLDYDGELPDDEALSEVESQKSKVESQKILIDGRLYILLPDGHIYDIQGRLVR